MSRGWLSCVRVASVTSGIAALVGTVALIFGAEAATGHAPRAHPADTQQCADPYPGTRDPSIPLDLPVAPGANPLVGARFFVDGPRHGEAAGAIAQLLGVNPTRFGDSRSWASFNAWLAHGRRHRKLQHRPALAYKVHLLEKIAEQPEAQRLSRYSAGGGPGAIFAQVQKIFCHNLTADPGRIPIITTYSPRC